MKYNMEYIRMSWVGLAGLIALLLLSSVCWAGGRNSEIKFSSLEEMNVNSRTTVDVPSCY